MSCGALRGAWFAQSNVSEEALCLGPRKKYVDIVTDTLHAPLLTWNTLVMIKLGWVSCIPREWGEITTLSRRGEGETRSHRSFLTTDEAMQE